jgi:hypothetical protein
VRCCSGKDVLDNQLIDVDGKRVVRVNDVQLIENRRQMARQRRRRQPARVSPPPDAERAFTAALCRSKVIDWADVGYLATDTVTATVQLKSSKDKLSRLHPVEIAQLAETLVTDTPYRGGRKP